MSSRTAAGRRKLKSAGAKEAPTKLSGLSKLANNITHSNDTNRSPNNFRNSYPSSAIDLHPVLPQPTSNLVNSRSGQYSQPSNTMLNISESKAYASSRSPVSQMSQTSTSSSSAYTGTDRYDIHHVPRERDVIGSVAPTRSVLFTGSHSTSQDRLRPPCSPTPPNSNRLTPSPLRSSPASSSAQVDQISQINTVDSASVSSGTESGSSMNANTPASVFSSSSGSTDSQSQNFVYPTSRSRAAPSSSPPRLKFRRKKKGQTDINVRVISVTGSNTPTSPSAISVPHVEPIHLGASTTPRSSTQFVYPSSRSRAHPTYSPLKIGSSRRKTDSPSSFSTGSEGSATSSGSRFMGIPLKKKKKPPSSPLRTNSDSSSSRPSTIIEQSQFADSDSGKSPDRGPTIQSKIGTYPMDPYDSTLLESDRYTTQLLKKLNAAGTPSWHHYGNNPPSSVLDLGCGQGQWMLDAAIAWKGYGTRVIGIDMVDVTKNLRATATKAGVVDNVEFVRANFLKKRLPFPDESFDLVRMSCLTYAISYDKWDFVLQEVCRVLNPGGRLELIDDHVFFPYGKPPLPGEYSRMDVPSPTSPSSVRTNQIERRDSRDLYRVDEYEEDASDTATLGGKVRSPPTSPHYNRQTASSTPSTVSMIASPEPDIWAEAASSAQDLELLFQNMLNMKYGIHLCPSEFLLDTLATIFGYSREMSTMHLTVAPPESPEERPVVTEKSIHRISRSTISSELDEYDLLAHSPGLILWPSTFIPLTSSEVEAHALRQPRALMALKSALTEYATEIGEDDDIEEGAVMEALWEYNGFLHSRFSPPPRPGNITSPGALEPGLSRTPSDDNNSIRSSVFSVASVTSESQQAMWEYQFDLRHHIAWPLEEIEPPATPRTASPGLGNPENPPLRGNSPGVSSTLPPSFSTNRAHSVAPPNYSQLEPIHIRTFHVYEAIKMDEQVFGTAAL